MWTGLQCLALFPYFQDSGSQPSPPPPLSLAYQYAIGLPSFRRCDAEIWLRSREFLFLLRKVVNRKEKVTFFLNLAPKWIGCPPGSRQCGHWLAEMT